jgi:hypothetical protein
MPFNKRGQIFFSAAEFYVNTDRRAINAYSEKASRQVLWYLYVNNSTVCSMDQLTIKNQILNVVFTGVL